MAATIPERKDGRRAFGPQRKRTLEQWARDVAWSIAQKIDHDNTWTFADYGIIEGSAKHQLVVQALAREQVV